MMNAAAGLVSSPLAGVVSQSPVDPAMLDTPTGSDFAATLLAVAPEDPQAGLPDGSQAAAAMALLAGLLAMNRPADALPPEPVQAETGLVDGFMEAGASASLSTGQQAAIGGLVGKSVSSAARSLDSTAPNVADSNAEMAAAAVASTVPPPLAIMRALGVNAPRDPGAVPKSDAGDAGVAVEVAASVVAPPAEPSRSERLVGSLLERVAANFPDSSVSAVSEMDQHSIAGPSLYASTRETVAQVAGAVSDAPEAVRSAVGSPRWANELGSRLVMMSMRGQQEGSLSLTPDHLGPLEVRISVSQDTTNIWFGAQHADTRAALTDAMPRLREMFAASGLALGHAGVSQEMPRQDARRSEFPGLAGSSNPEQVDLVPIASVRRSVRSGLLDAWA